MDNIDVQWIVRYLLMLLVVAVSYMYMMVSDNPGRVVTQNTLLFFLFAYSIEQILFRRDPWEGVKHSDVSFQHSDKCEELNSPQDDKHEVINSESAQRLTQWMRETKPYLNLDFQLTDLRAVLPMNRTYLSRFLRDEFGCTFYQFVNRYRIEEAKRLMTEQPDLKLDDVAAQSGFSSSVILIRVFNREVGLSPKEWQKSAKH